MDKITRYKIRQIDSKGIQERSGEIHRREYEYKIFTISKRFYKYNNGRKNRGAKMYKQIIIARKDLNMSPGKLAAQVSHASMAFLSRDIKKRSLPITKSMLNGLWKQVEPGDEEIIEFYSVAMSIDKDLYEQWLDGIFTKCILEAKNKNKLLKAKKMAEDMGMKENEDFFLIRDCCLTELEPEDEDGRTLTCIGFRPMDSEIIDKIGKKYQLYK